MKQKLNMQCMGEMSIKLNIAATAVRDLLHSKGFSFRHKGMEVRVPGMRPQCFEKKQDSNAASAPKAKCKWCKKHISS